MGHRQKGVEKLKTGMGGEKLKTGREGPNWQEEVRGGERSDIAEGT